MSSAMVERISSSESVAEDIAGAPPALETVELAKSFRVGRTMVRALRGVDLRVERGELVAVMGPSGCGKSTLLHALGGLLAPTSGRVVVEGRELSALSDAERTDLRRRRIGFVFQRFNLFPTLSVEGNLKLAERLSLGRRSAREGAGRRRALLEMLGIESKLRHRPMELSGGEQQRVALARAVIHVPAILLADEPTGNLDSASTENVLETLKRVHRELSQTIILITHDIDVAEAAERIVLMKDGALVDR
jgi:putative ABC transport system ATP-binding protein